MRSDLRVWLFLASIVAVGGTMAAIVGGLAVKAVWFFLVLDRIP